jgi:ribosomal protein L28
VQTRHEVDESEPEVIEDTVTCPNCRMKSPNAMYCLNCGYPLFTDESDQEPEKEELAKEEPVKEAAKPPQPERRPDFNLEEVKEEIKKWTITPVKSKAEERPPDRLVRVDKIPKRVSKPTNGIKPRPVEPNHQPVKRELEAVPGVDIIKAVMEELMKSISLELWLVDLLKEGKIDERNFLRRFEVYEARSRQCMNRRNEILTHARDLDALERALNDARVGLQELEMRKSLGDVKRGEYEVKAPALKWDIDNYEEELAQRRREIANLENVTWLVPQEEFTRMKRVADECLRSMDALAKSNGVSSRIATMVKDTLSSTLSYLDELSSPRKRPQ